MKHLFRTVTATLLSLASLVPASAFAGSSSYPVVLQASVASNCSASNAGSFFTSPAYVPTSGYPATAVGTVNVSCGSASPIVVSWSGLGGGTSTYAKSALTLAKIPLSDLSVNQPVTTTATMVAGLTSGETVSSSTASSFTFSNVGGTNSTVSLTLAIGADTTDGFVHSGDTISFQTTPVLTLNY